MPRRNHIPTYRLHKQSGQAIVTLPDGLGGRHDHLLGKYGTPQSRAEYARILAEWEAAGRYRPTPTSPGHTDLTIAELILTLWPHVEQYYRRPDGTPTSEVTDYKLSLRPLNYLYGQTQVQDFGPLALKAVRQLMVEGYEHPEHGPQPGLSRTVVNQRVGRIRRMFRWAVEEELVPSSVLHGLEAVRGLQRGRSAARETDPIKPVSLKAVEATLPHLRLPVAAMVRLQLLTGMRPGEVVVMRACDIEMTDKVWLYRPGSDGGPTGRHKTAHHGHQRIVAVGPKAQEIIRPFLKLDTQAYLFSPRDTVATFHAERRSRRRSKVPPSQVRRKRKVRPQRAPKDRYTVASYGRAIDRACERADREMRAKAKERGEDVPEGHVFVSHWHPHQLRHTRATEIRREYGLDVARMVLGHRSPRITELYAELDVSRAAEVMERFG